MNGVETALLIILSASLAVFLVLAIIIAVKILQILKHVRNVVDKAESIAENAKAVSDFFQTTSGPAAVVKLVSNIFNSQVKNKSK